MFAITLNLLAFYLGAIFIESYGVISGVAVFLSASLAGTILASRLEIIIGIATQRVFVRCGDRIARHSAERLYFGR